MFTDAIAVDLLWEWLALVTRADPDFEREKHLAKCGLTAIAFGMDHQEHQRDDEIRSSSSSRRATRLRQAVAAAVSPATIARATRIQHYDVRPSDYSRRQRDGSQIDITRDTPQRFRIKQWLRATVNDVM